MDVSSPDLTRRIMGRLGYMRVVPGAARRDRIRRAAGRSGIFLAAALAVGVGLRVFESGDQVRRAADITIPAAIDNDLQHHQRRIGNVIKTIRNLAVPRSQPAPAAEQDIDDGAPHTIDSDFVQPATLPYRWV